MTMARISAKPSVLTLGLLALCMVMASRNILAELPDGAPLWALMSPSSDHVGEMLVHYTLLPRLVVGILAGAGVGLAGAILQLVLRNPLAEPATLGVAAGSNLALTIATLYMPSALSAGVEWVAFAGAALALGAIMALSVRSRMSPVTVTLAGMIVSLYCGAASAVLALFHHDLLVGLFIWGAGYLDQQDWHGAAYLAPRLLALAGVAALLSRPLTMLTLGDDNARGLGLSPETVRIIALLVAAGLSSVVTVTVGVIAFVGLAAPALAQACGARLTGDRFVWSAAIGALLLTTADQMVLSLPITYRLFPTGAVTALFGAPLLFILIGRLRPPAAPGQLLATRTSRLRHPMIALCLLTAMLGPVFWLALWVGASQDGWTVLDSATLDLLQWRWPRALGAFCGGAMLALAGAILQRMTCNPAASPEALGVSSGAMLGALFLLLTVAEPTRTGQIIAGSVGAFGVLILMFALSRKAGYSGDRLLLIGVALSSVTSFVMATLMSAQDPRLGQALAWLSGSTYAVRSQEALISAFLLAAALMSILAIRRWLDQMALGEVAAKATGAPVNILRISLFALSSLLTAGAAILVGPLSFAGLMGPHLARLCGFRRAGGHLAASAIIGGLILLLADWIGRTVIFPFQIPAGLLATLVGGPLLLLLMGRKP
ncbi:ABC-type Fe3+-siderophore transport system permease subunit [Rhizobium sp. SG_E_25_P2]|uniref:Fe(3+)-hydroxamate ABC transporter permease FhuB n=1 Tax=Rhizobium sp. SG_E_25_P2 TaxID=2879942 RepID=UPI00247724F5|nr:Fe(3+)-hydroxamate ABC transporter permease FhuB [Rhizobium sp. SG_E_25_P2]MDH6265947.1 ABC-type Fe3+-siderophore transport system permease subunit [Rhizobium sp. SG_E_25_P2]